MIYRFQVQFPWLDYTIRGFTLHILKNWCSSKLRPCGTTILTSPSVSIIHFLGYPILTHFLVLGIQNTRGISTRCMRQCSKIYTYRLGTSGSHMELASCGVHQQDIHNQHAQAFPIYSYLLRFTHQKPRWFGFSIPTVFV